MPRSLSPSSFEAAASSLAGAAAGGEIVRIVGAGTKRWWGTVTRDPDVEMSTRALDRIVEHNAGDLTAELEAGVPLARAQQQFAAAGQMLALDPWLGSKAEATIGGILATADSGPLRHRYGAPRDLVLGMTVALSDGTIARSGGRVIKNVAGYDLAKLFCGSFGTLGLVLSVNVRLHPLPERTATALGMSDDASQLARAAQALCAQPLELEALDVAWRGGMGGLLARCAGADPEARAARVARAMSAAGLQHPEVATHDAALWERQRSGQRSMTGAAVRISARPSRLADVIAAVRSAEGTLVGRACLGTYYVELAPERVPMLRELLPH